MKTALSILILIGTVSILFGMSRTEAQEKAIQIWGPNGSTVTTQVPGIGNLYEIGYTARDGRFLVMSAGSSWDMAFAGSVPRVEITERTKRIGRFTITPSTENDTNIEERFATAVLILCGMNADKCKKIFSTYRIGLVGETQ